MSYPLIFSLALVSMLTMSAPLKAGQCPEFLNQNIQKLHSSKTLNICETYVWKAVAYCQYRQPCGFTPQFSRLENLYTQYKDKRLVVLGFASNDFNQEAKGEQEISNVCFINYCVTFDMFAPIKVIGASAHPLFKALSAQTKESAWNFNKYLVHAEGKVVQYFDSQVTPNSPAMKQAIEQLLTH